MSREGIQMVVARKTFDGLKEEVKTRKSLCDHFENLNKKNFEENKELKEENKKLKEENEQLEEQLEYDGGRRRRAIGGVHKLFEENKTLKDANLSSLLSERALLKQIKELKEELDSSFSALEVSLITSASVENEEENEKLKEENEKLKKQKKNLVRICRSVRKSAAESQRGDMIMKLQRQARERHQEEEEEKKPEDFLDFAYELGGPALLDAIDSLCAGASKVW